MKRTLLLASLLVGCAASAANFPGFPAFDPFVNATGSGGTSYAVGSKLAQQTNAMGQYWYGIDTGGPAASAITNTGNALSYQGLPGFSGNTLYLNNVGGPGGRMFFSPSGNFFTNGPLSIFYSFVFAVSNAANFSAAGDFCAGFGDQAVISDQNSQPNTLESRLYFRKSGSGYNVGFSKAGTTNWASTVYNAGDVLFLVADYEIIVGVGSSTKDHARLWINPDPSTFGAQTLPTETVAGTTADGNLTPFVGQFQIYNHSTSGPSSLYVTDFRMGTNWGWVTGGPGIGAQPVAATNCPNGLLNLNVLAMNNGTANAYQWQFNGANLTNGPSVSGSGATASGATTASLTLSGMDTSGNQLDSGSYTVVVTNNYGAVTSVASIVTANSAPVITAGPGPASLRLFTGTTNLLPLTVSGFAPFTYYWFTNNTLDSAVAASAFPAAAAGSGANLYCIVSNSLGTATSSVVALSIVSTPTSPYPAAVNNDHPIGFWPLNEGPDNSAGDNGVASYDYEGGNNGYYTNAVLGQLGYGPSLTNQYGYATATDTGSSAQFGSFASLDSCVAQIPNINFGSGTASSFSVEAWVNGNNQIQTSGASIVNKGYGGAGEQFTLDYISGWRFYVRNASSATVIALSTNQIDANWHHLVGVADAVHSALTIYVDGFARTTTALTPSAGILASSDPVLIGSRKSAASSGDYNDNFNGFIQDVAIYNYALSPTQVVNHYYAAGIGPTVSAPYSVTVNEGATLVIPATAVGSPALAYQWTDSTSGPGTVLAGQTNATLVISNVSAASFNNHTLNAVVTNLYGQASVAVSVQVNQGAPNTASITPASTAVYAGRPAVFSVTAQGTEPFSYTWSTNGTPVPGATSSSYTNVTSQPGSWTVACLVTNASGSAPLATATLTVAPLPADLYGSIVLAAGPLAFWRLDEPANATVAYDYVGGHNANYNNAVNGQSGFSPTVIPAETATLFGQNGATPSFAQEADNTASGVPLLDFASQGANAEFSVEAWVNAPPQSTDVISKGYPNNTQFALDTAGSGNTFRFVVHNAAGTIITANSGSVAADGNWHHLVGVCDEAAGAVRLYADGSLKSSASITPGSGVLSLASTFRVVIAAQENQAGSSFTCMSNAVLSQVALYPYALPASQVSSNFLAATFVPPTLTGAFLGGNLVLSYTGTLLSSTNVAGPYTNVVAGAVSPYTNSPTASRMFFRSRANP